MKDREQRTVKRGLRGLYPLDNSVTIGTPEAMAAEIFRGNVAMIDEAQAIVSDIPPFRGPNILAPWEIVYGTPPKSSMVIPSGSVAELIP